MKIFAATLPLLFASPGFASRGRPVDTDTRDVPFSDENGLPGKPLVSNLNSARNVIVTVSQPIDGFIDTPQTLNAKCTDIASASNGSVKSVLPVIHGCVITTSPNQIGGMSSNSLVEKTEEDMSVRMFDVPWGLDRVNECDLPLDGNATKVDAANVTVLVIDTGINKNHVDFQDLIDPDSPCNKEFVDGQEDPLVDGNGHGTHVAGTICGETYGVATNVDELCAVKVLSNSGSGSTAGVLEGIQSVIDYCKDGKKCVANMSLGSSVSTAMNEAVAGAVDSGVVMVVAAGNHGDKACLVSPASEPKAITVGSTKNTDEMSGFSAYGECVDVYAPGSDIKSAWIPGDSNTKTISGTSMASPHVAGIAAHILSLNQQFTPQQVRDEIVGQAFPTGVYDEDGFAIAVANTVDPEVQMCNAPSPPPTPGPPTPSPTPCQVENIIVSITTDNYPGETKWTLINECNSETVGEGGPYATANSQQELAEICSPEQAAYTFTITDTYGDGICCSYGEGHYHVTRGETELVNGASFESSMSHGWGSCPPTSPPVTPTTPSPVTPITPSPVTPITPSPVTPTTPSPVTPNTPPPVTSPTPPTGDTLPLPIQVHLHLLEFTFTPALGCHQGGVSEKTTGTSSNQCAQACAVLVDCIGFEEFLADVPGYSAGTCVLATNDSSEDCDSSDHNTFFFERTVIMILD